MSSEKAILVEHLIHTYGKTAGNQSEALNNISFSISSGEFVAVIGQNGAGKTTLVKHFNGLLRPTSGSVRIFGMDASRERVSTLAKKVGFVFQNPDHQIFKNTVLEEVAFGPANMGLAQQEVISRSEKALKAVGLLEYEHVSPQNLSKGQRQRVALASVLAMETEIIVLDEPTTGQDYRESLQIMDLAAELNKQGHTVIFITHDMSLVARYAKRALVLCEGKLLLDGPVSEIFQQKELLQKTFLTPPQIMELASAFPHLVNAADILTPQDLFAAFTSFERRVASGSSY